MQELAVFSQGEQAKYLFFVKMQRKIFLFNI